MVNAVNVRNALSLPPATINIVTNSEDQFVTFVISNILKDVSRDVGAIVEGLVVN